MPEKIILFDGFSVLNRAFYAMPLLSTKDGEYTNAVFGFMNMFLRFIDEEKPDYITVAFDLPQPTFRHEEYGPYKGTRKSMPDELRAQVPTLKGLLSAMEINMAQCPGFEADDVIGTLAAKAVAQGIEPVIISGDRDLLQLATDIVRIRLPKTKAGKTEVEDYYAPDVLARYGVSPSAFIDVKALMGDASDNVPGVPGIGEVTATKIITAYGSLENALENASEIKPKKAAENLVTFKDQAILSKVLVTIVQDAPVELILSPTQNMWNLEAQAEVKRLELKSLYKRFDNSGTTATNKPASDSKVAETAPPCQLIQDLPQAQEFINNLITKSTPHPSPVAIHLLWHKTTKASSFAKDQDNAEFEYSQHSLVGMAIATEAATTYIGTGIEELSLFSNPGMSGEELLGIAKPLLESQLPKCMYDIKSEAIRLVAHNIHLNFAATFDTMLGAYVLDSLPPSRSPADIAATFLQKDLPDLEDILDNKGKRTKGRRSVIDLPIETAAQYAGDIAIALLQATPLMEKQLVVRDQMYLYKDMEIPVAETLLDMEIRGIQVDRDVLQSYGNKLSQRIDQLTTEIYDQAGEEFNINSPGQMGTILFEKLGLKGGKKNTKGYSTAAEELEKLADKHQIIPLIMEYRAHTKLKSTYIDGLLPLINPATQRIHSTFNQALTATGRLSSAEPNLQNIPVRLPIGRELRKAFVPKPGHIFLDADYSQIELRLLAHMSGDKILIEAFKNNQDIHRLTAAQVLGIAPEYVTDEQRSNAKAVNFGIIYGISAYGLSTDLKISVKEAESYISGYFRQYPGVKRYLDTTIENARIDGFVATLFNRRRHMPELKSHNFNLKSFGERVAMNMPIQGTAADIIKIAMVNVANRLKNEGLQAKLILQIHDELLLEVPLEEVEVVTNILRSEMEGVASLDVPLVADVNIGSSWFDTK